MGKNGASASAVSYRAQHSVLDVVALGGPQRCTYGNAGSKCCSDQKLKVGRALLCRLVHDVAGKVRIGASALPVGFTAKQRIVNVGIRVCPVVVQEIGTGISGIVGI